MAKRTGLSHASAAFIGLIVADIMLTYVRPAFPRLTRRLETMAESGTILIERLSGVELSHRLLVPAVVATLLAFIWGLLYHRWRFRDD